MTLEDCHKLIPTASVPQESAQPDSLLSIDFYFVGYQLPRGLWGAKLGSFMLLPNSAEARLFFLAPGFPACFLSSPYQTFP